MPVQVHRETMATPPVRAVVVESDVLRERYWVGARRGSEPKQVSFDYGSYPAPRDREAFTGGEIPGLMGVPVREARAFAEGIIELCDQIEGAS